MSIFGLAFTIFHLVAFAVFTVLFCLGAAFDRRGNEGFKWWVLFGAFIVLVSFSIGSISLASIWGSLTSASFWQMAGIYAILGLTYSVIEFFLHVRKNAKETSTSWAKFIKKQEVWFLKEIAEISPELASFVKDGRLNVSNEEVLKFGDEEQRARVLQSFTYYHSSKSNLIKIKSAENSVKPVIDRDELASHIGAWSVFWPFYAISLVFGDLLEEVWDTIARFIIKISEKFVNSAFSNIFKI